MTRAIFIKYSDCMRESCGIKLYIYIYIYIYLYKDHMTYVAMTTTLATPIWIGNMTMQVDSLKHTHTHTRM